jgi:hypothetical protein
MFPGEVLGAIVVVTLARVVLIVKRPLPHDVQSAVMNGARRIGKVLKGEVRVGGNAPYGVVWYAINVPLAGLVRYDGRRWMVLLALLDSIFLWFSQAMGPLGFVAYICIGTFQLIRAPWNVTIDWIIVLGLFNWWFLILAPIAKLPIGLPLHAFGDTSRGLFYQHNYIYYGLLGTLWLIVFLDVIDPLIRDLSLGFFGIAWVLLLGFLYFRKKSRT